MVVAFWLLTSRALALRHKPPLFEPIWCVLAVGAVHSVWIQNRGIPLGWFLALTHPRCLMVLIATSMAFLKIDLLCARLLILVLQFVEFELIAFLLSPLRAHAARPGEAQFLAVL